MAGFRQSGKQTTVGSMARYGITYEEVDQAAEGILQQGRNPTMESIRSVLGAGSFTTINKHLHTWRAKKLVASAKCAPEKIITTNEVSQAVNGIWEQLNQQAQQQVDKIKQESQAKINEFLQEKQQLETSNHTFQQELNHAKTQLNHLQTDITLLKEALREEKGQRLVAEEKAKGAENTLAKVETEITQQRTELKQVYEDAVKKLQTQYEDDINRLKTLVEAQRTDFMLKLDALTVAKEKLAKTQIKLEAELTHQSTRNAELEERGRRAEFDLQMAQQHQQEQDREVITLKVEIRQKDDIVSELKEQIKNWQQKMELAAENIGQLKAHLKKDNKSNKNKVNS